MSLSSKQECLIELKSAEMVPHCGGVPCLREAHCLKPSFPETLLEPPPNPPSTKPVSTSSQKLYSKVHFNGWRSPLKGWNAWVEKMCCLHGQTWRNACVYEAIMASRLEVPKCYASLFVFAERWCPETSSFVFPWGEVSVTLEDVLVLGGYALSGDSVKKKLDTAELCEVKEKLYVVRSSLMDTKLKKASQNKWMEIWMGNGSEIEHEAFLTLWLSRYVFPADDISTVNKSVLSVAVLLARGIKLALAPAVLASIYRDLRLLKGKIESLRDLGDGGCDNVSSLKLWAPLQLFQAWIWERFPDLSPRANSISDGLRLERWNKVRFSKNVDVAHVGKVVDSAGGSFVWRPYSIPLNHWLFCTELYPEKGAWAGFNFEYYAKCVRTSRLVGLEDSDSDEQYFPHRVSMQFGLDQDVPYVLPNPSDTKVIDSLDYNRPIVDVRLYVPPKNFESHVTVEYLEWWKKSKDNKEKFSYPFQGFLKASINSSELLRIKTENNAEVPPGFDPKGKKASSDLTDPPSFKRSKSSPWHINCRTKSKGTNASSRPSLRVKGMQTEDDDGMTLSQLFPSKCSERAKSNNTRRVIGLDSPLSSAGENESLQEVINNAGEAESIGCSRDVLHAHTIEDGTAYHAGNPARSPMETCKRKVGVTSGSTSEPLGMGLLDRMARLQRLLDIVKAAKID